MYRLVKFMTGWAIQQRHHFIFWRFIRHGDYFEPYYPGQKGNVVQFNSDTEAREWFHNLFHGQRLLKN